MKLFNLIVFFLSMIFLSGCTTDKTDNKQTDWEKWNLNGKVKSIVDTTFFAVEKFGEAVKTDSIKEYSTVKFNENGFITEEYGVKYLHGYEKVVHDYNAQGLRVRTKYFDRGDSLIVKIDYKYDEQDRVSEENTFDSEEELIKKSIYRRPNDNLVEKSEYNSEGKLIKTVTSKYNKEGLLIERNNYSEESKTSDNVEYRYDKQGRVISKVTSTPEGVTSRTTECLYNDAGDLFNYRLEFPLLNQILPLDEQGWSDFEIHYQYDENGNWIKSSFWSGSNDTKKKPGQIIERKIYYY